MNPPIPAPTHFRRFKLYRREDPNRFSGTGYITEGCEFSNGKVAMSWMGAYATTTVFDSINQVKAIHGHDGATVIEWLD